MEVAESRNVFFCFRERQRQLPRRIVVAEKDIRDSVACCIAQVPGMDETSYRVYPWKGDA